MLQMRINKQEVVSSLAMVGNPGEVEESYSSAMLGCNLEGERCLALIGT